jgi:aminoglycoside/choline kinase family phosphotransferase
VNNPLFSKLISVDGTLNLEQLLYRQPMYRGRNGRVVERIHISTPQGTQSYIFKPLTNPSNMGKEQWVHHSLLADTAIPSPQLLAASEDLVPETFWTIFEDLGDLNHHLSDHDYLAAARLIPLWHVIPIEKVPETYCGDKPSLMQVIASIKQNWVKVSSSLQLVKLNLQQINQLFSIVDSAKDLAEQEMVISHGDLCFGNIGMVSGKMYVLDWEFVHRNFVFWDLYCLLDMTHPLVRKTINNKLREQVLSAYLEEREALGLKSLHASFKTDYLKFSTVYSIWMLLLIEQDLQANLWDKSDLLACQIEVVKTLSDHLDAI